MYNQLFLLSICTFLHIATLNLRQQRSILNTTSESHLFLTFSCSMFFLCCLIFFTSSGRSGIPFPASSSWTAAYSRQKAPVRPTPELRQKVYRLINNNWDAKMNNKDQNLVGLLSAGSKNSTRVLCVVYTWRLWPGGPGAFTCIEEIPCM